MSEGTLKKTLGPLTLWGLGVGYVISGEYFGWNLGLPLAGTYGMLAATALVTLMYAAFVPCYAELAVAMPDAGGAFTYVGRAFGRPAGALAGYAQAIEFVFAPPAIAMAIAAYLTQRYAGLDPRVVAMLAYLAFSALNAWGVRQAARFELVVAGLAVAELLLFIFIALPHFDVAAFSRNALPHGARGVFDALPFAIWFYLAIEGLANTAEEARDPQRDLGLGFLAAMLTLALLAVGVFVSSVGVAGWEAVVYPPGSSDASDAPLPLALGRIVGEASVLYGLLVGVGLLGLVASFHGILLVAARALLALGRERLLPSVLANVHEKTGTPRNAIALNLALGGVAILTGKTSEIITLSVFGAVTLYVLTMLAYFRLRRAEPELARPFRAPLFPLLPLVALGLSVTCLVAIAVTNPMIGAVFVGCVALPAVYAKLRAAA